MPGGTGAVVVRLPVPEFAVAGSYSTVPVPALAPTRAPPPTEVLTPTPACPVTWPRWFTPIPTPTGPMPVPTPALTPPDPKPTPTDSGPKGTPMPTPTEPQALSVPARASTPRAAAQRCRQPVRGCRRWAWLSAATHFVKKLEKETEVIPAWVSDGAAAAAECLQQLRVNALHIRRRIGRHAAFGQQGLVKQNMRQVVKVG